MCIRDRYDLPHLTEEEHSLHLRFTMAVAKRMFEMTDKLPKKQGWEKPYPMITQAELDSIEFALKMVLWAKETHPKLVNDLMKEYKGTIR